MQQSKQVANQVVTTRSDARDLNCAKTNNSQRMDAVRQVNMGLLILAPDPETTLLKPNLSRILNLEPEPAPHPNRKEGDLARFA